MQRLSELLEILNQQIEKGTGIKDVPMGLDESDYLYPGKIIHMEEPMAQITLTQMDFMNAMQNTKNQHNQYASAQNQMSQGLSGLGSGYGQLGGQLPPHLLQQVVNNPSPPRLHYPGIGEAFHGVFGNPKIKAVAEHHGFVHDFDSDCFRHPNGGFVSKRMLEDCSGGLHELFHKAKSPNITWLEDRIEEIRFKL